MSMSRVSCPFFFWYAASLPCQPAPTFALACVPAVVGAHVQGTHAQPLLCHSSVLLQEVMASRSHCSLEWGTSGKSGFTELKQCISISKEETLKIPDFLRNKNSFKVSLCIKTCMELEGIKYIGFLAETGLT